MKRALTFLILLFAIAVQTQAQVNTDRVMAIGRNALYFEDYVLSIQYFNQVIKAKPWMAEPYFYRAVAKLNLDDFRGAEEDCTLSLERNPFLAQAYYARGIARQSLEKYAEAIEDYTKGLEFKPGDRAMMSNKAIAYVQKKDFTDAEQVFEELIRAHPKQSLGYLTRAAMYLEKGDTAKALSDYDRAIELDPFYAPCYGNRALTLYQSGRYAEALKDLNEAIRLNTREVGYYINRGLVRYELHDLRGAMADYDQVIEMDADNRIARFNRGLLRAQVGDDNRAIEDFDVVLRAEPDNDIARFNRATLLFKTGDYRATIRDLDAVLRRYPDFVQGYYYRADVKRRLNDLKGADRDYIAAMKIEEDRRRGRRSNTSTASVDSTKSGASDRTREESDRNIEKFNRLVVYDRKEEQKSKYQSEIRGRVQDRNVQVDLEPMFVLTYYERQADVRERVFYDRLVERFNDRRVLAWRLLLTNREAALTEEQIAAHFASIDDYARRIERAPANADLHFGRALDYLLVQDFAEALRDLDRTIELAPDSFPLAYFARAIVRYKQLESARSQQPDATPVASASPFRFGAATRPSAVASPDTREPSPADEARRHEHELILRDYDRVIRLAPNFAFAYFNRGNLRCTGRDFRAAIADYDEAIRRDPELAEAYFNRGLAELSMGNATRGIVDLSKAGELGLPGAYSIIRRMTEESKSNE